MTAGKENSEPFVPGSKRLIRLGPVVLTGLICLVIPLSFAIAASQLARAKGPQWLPYSFENPYAYLFNSLLLVNGQSPAHIDHPGTTTQVFGAIVLRAFSTKSQDQLIAGIVQDPEKYLRKIHWALLAFTFLILWVCPWITSLVVRDWAVGLLIQAPSLFYHCLFTHAFVFGSDLMVVPFSIATVCLCYLLIAPSLAATRLDILLGLGAASANRTFLRVGRIPVIAALTGLVCAFGIVTKLTFFPLILISLFCCRNLRNLASFAATFILGLAIALVPIYSRLPRLGTWIFNLGIHRGRYGGGELGFPETTTYIGSARSLIDGEPLLLIVPLVACVGVTIVSLANIGTKSDSPRLSWRTALPLLGLQAISFMAIVKHPGPHYLIPLCVSTGFSLVLFLCVLRTTNGAAIRRVAGWTMLVGLIVLGLRNFADLTPKMYRDLLERKADLLRLYKHAEEITQNDVRVDYYFSDSPEFPLCFGNDFSGGAFGGLLASRHPKALFFNVFAGRFETFTDSMPSETVLQQHDHLYFLGDLTHLVKFHGFDPEKLRTIDQARGFYLQEWTREGAFSEVAKPTSPSGQ